jgi:hypothetical protein
MLLPSHCLRGPQIPLGHLRLSKLLAVCLLELLLTRTVVVIFAMEHDGRYGVAEFVRYDSQQVLLDLIALFVLGEFWRQPGVDTLFFVAVSTAGALANSVLNELSSALQVSVSLYSMHCSWGATTWVFATGFLAAAGALAVAHARHAHRSQIVGSSLLRLGLFFLLFWAPGLLEASQFHVHHWFYSWFLAAALPCYAPWWSRATQAWFIGGYLNGIAVYGRDPVLACADVYFRAWGISETPCFFADPNHCRCTIGNTTVVAEPPVDWRACTGDYHR